MILKYRLCIILILIFVSCNYIPTTDNAKVGVFGDSLYLKSIPSQPGEDSWKFVEDLKSPLWRHTCWKEVSPGSARADLSVGVKLETRFPDPKGRLETAYDDFRVFLAAGDVSCSDSGKYLLKTDEDKTLQGESFRIEVEVDKCRISAGDIEGVRRGIFYVEDEILRHRSAFLATGIVEKDPIIKRRISRCFFGPIKRPPSIRDELMDNIDYYPDQYLNRLAHEGVNGLWLTVEFQDLVATSFTPDTGKNGEQRLTKLRRTVEKCLRYGIKTYIFCIEPNEWGVDDPVLIRYPELAGGPTYNGGLSFCPCSRAGRKYLYESVHNIFKAVPELGGMINISLGERPTICLNEMGFITCPRCAGKAPWKVLAESLTAMEQGMHDAAPEAELISWLYLPQPKQPGDWVYELAAHTPKGVILQFNFETGVSKTVFGRTLVGGDYWLSDPGPSERFIRMAETARKSGTEISAKIQAGCSHEVASVPYVPVPSNLYRKFSGMKNLGVSHTMMCWYFGNYPGLMNKAVGELSMEPFPKDEDSFLKQLAALYWKQEDTLHVIEAWELFSESYKHYPLSNFFQYYGPMTDGPVWPLLFEPVDAPLSPTWQINSRRSFQAWPPSGDRIGECVGNELTLDEVVELCRQLSTTWDKGVKVLQKIEAKYIDEPNRTLDIGVAKALGIQFRSGYNILRFYALREKMFQMEGKDRLKILQQLIDIARDELKNDKQLIVLCEKDSRLGFHSEAEGYKYFPAKIRWRMAELKNSLENDVPELKKMIDNDQLLFPEYTGKKPTGSIAYATPSDGSLWRASKLNELKNLQWQSCLYGSDTSAIRWAAVYNEGALYIVVTDSSALGQSQFAPGMTGITVKLEPRRLWPSIRYLFDFNEGKTDPWNDAVHVEGSGNRQFMVVRIPFESFRWNGEDTHPIRLDVRVHASDGNITSWRPDNPCVTRLKLGSDNPADLGWLVFSR